jgi:V8-like Glu-specific endopeptidase
MFEITSPTSAPYASICYIRSDWSDGTATRASGVIVGDNDVLTALHAVYDPLLGWATHVSISPGTDTSPFFTAPFGSFAIVNPLPFATPTQMVGRAPTWDTDGDGLLTQEESQGDIALLGLTTRIGDLTGWLPAVSYSGDFNGTMVGYPARGSGMMAEAVFADASSMAGVYDIGSGLGPGASGGPLLYMANGVTSVAGVLSSGNAADTLSTYAGLFGPGTYSWLQHAIAANDTLLGLPPGSAPVASPNVIMGTGGANTITGTAGTDVIHGLGGNDSIDGSWGVDTAVYTGTRASHIVTQPAANTLQVTDTVASRDGSDTLWNVERVRFDDISLAFDYTGDAGQAYRLYIAAFNRTPDQSGLGFQISALDSGFSLVQIANGFLASPEFSAKYGALNNADYITQLYRNVLHREPEQDGLDFHLNELASGESRAMVLTHFSESPECQALLLGQAQNGIAYIAA